MRIEWIQEFHFGAIFFPNLSLQKKSERKNEKEKE